MTEVRAQMAATIVELQHDDGASVAAGDVLLYLESMKMQIPVPAPVDGTVRYHVSLGDNVDPGTLLATVTVSAGSAEVDHR